MDYFLIFFLKLNIVYLVFCNKQNSPNIYEILDGLMTPFNVFKKSAVAAETKIELEELNLYMNYNR